ncbi:unnamed protein product [Amoebophrya sp. A25]|nr:unnamed protein product [Amoebophrya sp. A25]|eukprot:GSA25T00019211001.1
MREQREYLDTKVQKLHADFAQLSRSVGCSLETMDTKMSILENAQAETRLEAGKLFTRLESHIQQLLAQDITVSSKGFGEPPSEQDQEQELVPKCVRSNAGGDQGSEDHVAEQEVEHVDASEDHIMSEEAGPQIHGSNSYSGGVTEQPPASAELLQDVDGRAADVKPDEEQAHAQAEGRDELFLHQQDQWNRQWETRSSVLERLEERISHLERELEETQLKLEDRTLIVESGLERTFNRLRPAAPESVYGRITGLGETSNEARTTPGQHVVLDPHSVLQIQSGRGQAQVDVLQTGSAAAVVGGTSSLFAANEHGGQLVLDTTDGRALEDAPPEDDVSNNL